MTVGGEENVLNGLRLFFPLPLSLSLSNREQGTNSQSCAGTYPPPPPPPPPLPKSDPFPKAAFHISQRAVTNKHKLMTAFRLTGGAFGCSCSSIIIRNRRFPRTCPFLSTLNQEQFEAMQRCAYLSLPCHRAVAKVNSRSLCGGTLLMLSGFIIQTSLG